MLQTWVDVGIKRMCEDSPLARQHITQVSKLVKHHCNLQKVLHVRKYCRLGNFMQCFYSRVKFSQLVPRNYFNSEIFLMCGIEKVSFVFLNRPFCVCDACKTWYKKSMCSTKPRCTYTRCSKKNQRVLCVNSIVHL